MDTKQWTVTDPNGVLWTKRSKTRVFTHALIRQNKGHDTYFVNWASSEQNALKESRVLRSDRAYVDIVELVAPDGESPAAGSKAPELERAPNRPAPLDGSETAPNHGGIPLSAEVIFNHIDDVPLGALIDVAGLPYDLVAEEQYPVSTYMSAVLLGRSYGYIPGSTMIRIQYGNALEWLIVPSQQPIPMIEEPSPDIDIAAVAAPRLELLDLKDGWQLPSGNVLITGTGYGSATRPIRKTLMGTISQVYRYPDSQVLVALNTDVGEQTLLVDPAVELSNARAWVDPSAPPVPTRWEVMEREDAQPERGKIGVTETDWEVAAVEKPRTPATAVTWDDDRDPANIFAAAFVDENRWNGWAKPFFGQADCVRLAAFQRDSGDSTQYEYDDARDVWQEVNVEEDHRADCNVKEVNGGRCHELGSGFTWMEIPDAAEMDAETLDARYAGTYIGEMRENIAGYNGPADAAAWVTPALEGLPIGAVANSQNADVAWIKIESGMWANYENWSNTPITSEQLAYVSGGELRQGTKYFEDLAAGRTALPEIPLEFTEAPGTPAAYQPPERLQGRKVGVLALRKGSQIVNDAGSVATVDRILRSGDSVHLRVINDRGQAGKLTVPPDKQFIELPPAVVQGVPDIHSSPVLQTIGHDNGPGLS